MKRRLVLAALLSLLAMSVASAQYLNRRDPKTPRLPNGKPDMTAPAPRLASGRIDLGGFRVHVQRPEGLHAALECDCSVRAAARHRHHREHL